MSLLIRTADFVSAITVWAGRLASLLLLAMIGLVFYNVAGRYVFSDSPVWIQELEWHLLAPIALLGMSVLMLENGHVRVDMLYERLSERKRHMLDLFSMLVGVLISIMFVRYSYGFVESAWSIGEGSADPGGLPARYVVKAVIPASFVLFGMQCLANAIRHFAALRAADG